MKRNLLILVIILLIGFIVNSCGDEEKETPVCNLGAHLGIGETCNGSNCSLQNYNTSTGTNAFPKPIYRVGPVGDFNANALTKTVNDIMITYTDPSILGLTTGHKMLVNQRLDFVQIHKEGGDYTWKDKVLGLRAGLDADYIGMYIYDIASSAGLTPTAQLQPSNDIHLAKGKKQKEQFYVVTIIKGKFLNAIIINNHRIVNC